jgi:hypothetical protein
MVIIIINFRHPVYYNGEFVFPNKINDTKVYQNIVSIYDFVLDSHHLLTINGIECVTFGHGFIENNVVKHEYFGTDRIINDLKKNIGYEKGLIELSYNSCVRNINNENRINSIKF